MLVQEKMALLFIEVFEFENLNDWSIFFSVLSILVLLKKIYI